MGFWEEHAEREAELAPPPVPSLQDAPMTCHGCGHHGEDVLLGYCSPCHGFPLETFE